MPAKKTASGARKEPAQAPGGTSSGSRLAAGAVPAAELAAPFPPIDLPVRPPLPPMEAESAAALPAGPGGAGGPGSDLWLYEPKWDGFRCLAFRRGDEVLLQSKAGQPLGRYFPEAVAGLATLPGRTWVLDGELVILAGGTPDFEALLQRIHPAESRIAKLARDTPATFMAFDLLVDERGRSLLATPFAERRERLERMAAKWPEGGPADLSPATRDRNVAAGWLRDLAGGLDGVVAKRLDEPYRSGERSLVKVKRIRTADCVVGGFRWAQTGKTAGQVGSLLLGLYDEQGLLHHVGFAASFTAEERKTLKPILTPLIEPPGFTGKAPGGPSRWSQGRNTDWEPLRPSLVCEVRYDHFAGGRFRHGSKFLRWRPDKKPAACTFAQL